MGVSRLCCLEVTMVDANVILPNIYSLCLLREEEKVHQISSTYCGRLVGKDPLYTYSYTPLFVTYLQAAGPRNG